MNLRDLTSGDPVGEMHGVYVNTGRPGEWEALLAELRCPNSPRPSMIQVLGRPILMPERIAPS